MVQLLNPMADIPEVKSAVSHALLLLKHAQTIDMGVHNQWRKGVLDTAVNMLQSAFVETQFAPPTPEKSETAVEEQIAAVSSKIDQLAEKLEKGPPQPVAMVPETPTPSRALIKLTDGKALSTLPKGFPDGFLSGAVGMDTESFSDSLSTPITPATEPSMEPHSSPPSSADLFGLTQYPDTKEPVKCILRLETPLDLRQFNYWKTKEAVNEQLARVSSTHLASSLAKTAKGHLTLLSQYKLPAVVEDPRFWNANSDGSIFNKTNVIGPRVVAVMNGEDMGIWAKRVVYLVSDAPVDDALMAKVRRQIALQLPEHFGVGVKEEERPPGARPINPGKGILLLHFRKAATVPTSVTIFGKVYPLHAFRSDGRRRS